MLRILAPLFCLAALVSGEARGIFVNQKVSTRTVALNQPVRIELTTVPRQIEGVDIAACVADAINLGSGQAWRLVGKPAVQTDEKTKTLRISATLLPRAVGEAALPSVPLSWLNGDQIADFGNVKVEAQLVVSSETHPLPAEITAIHGFAWGSKLEELRLRLPTGSVSDEKDRSVAKAQPGLDLIFRGGELCEAQLATPDLTLDTARSSFLARWGAPQIEENGTVTWMLGWVRISAAASTDGKGITLSLVREDILARITKSRITERVFGLLEGPAAPPAAEKPAPAPEKAAPAPTKPDATLERGK